MRATVERGTMERELGNKKTEDIWNENELHEL